MANQIRFNVGFQVDKAGLSELQNQLTQIAVEAGLPSNKLNTGLQEAAKTARVVEGALQKAFNVNLGTTNISKFNQELKNNNLTIQQVKNNLSQAGSAGANAFNLLGTQILKTNVQLKESNKLLDNMAVSMANTIKWGITSSIFNNISGSIQKAYGYAKNLDTSLNDIRIVTDKSAESMEKFAVQANEAAKGLGASTLDYTQASLIYYQQGLSDEEVKTRAETTLKAANVTGQTGAEVSEQLTAVWNGYKVTAQEAELYVDKLAAVAATTAADLEELSTGMSKVASAASIMGVDIDQLNAQLATIVSVTRQAPESVGTALKTIYARMGDIEAGIDTETTLGNYTEAMAEMGFNVLDMNGNLRDMGEVIEEIGSKWSTMTREQQVSLSQTVAGTRQYNNLLALFDNWGMYTDAIETSTNAMGTLQKQQDIYMESTKAKLQELKTTMQSVYDGLIDTDELNAGVDALTNLAQVADNFIGSFGGGLKSIASIAAVVANIFNKQIANGINNVILNHKKLAENADLVRTKYELLKSAQQSMQGATDPQGMAIAANYDAQVKYAEQIKNLQLGMKTEEYERLTTLQGQVGELQQQIVLETELANQEAIKVGYTEEQIKNFYEQNTSMEDEINKAQQTLDKQQEKTQELQEQVNALKEIGNLAKQEELTETQINDIIDITAGINDEILKDKEKEVKTVSDLRKLIEQINKSENNGLNANKKQTKEYQNQLKVLKQIEQAKNKTTGLTQQRNSIEQELNVGIEQQKQSANVLAKVTTVSSALSSVAMTWMSVNSLMQTWNDDNASFGDKILQTTMTLGMAIPSLISTYNKLNETIGLTFNVSKILNTQKAKNIALLELETAMTAKENAATAASLVADELKNVSYAKTEAAIMKKIAAGELDVLTTTAQNGAAKVSIASGIVGEQLTNKQAKALWLKIVAQQADKTATDAQTASQLALNAAQLANPVGLIIAGLVALTAAIAIAVSWQAKQLEKEKELAQARIDEANATQAEIDANTDLYNSYMKINEQYKQGIASKDDMKTAAEQVSKALDIEGVAVANLTGNYDALTESIVNAQKVSIKEGLQEAEEEKGAAETVMLNTAREGRGRVFGEEYQLDLDTGSFYKDENKAREALNQFVTTGFDNTVNSGTYQIHFDANNAQLMLETYEQLAEALAWMENTDNMSYTERAGSKFYNQAREWVDKMTESVEQYKAAIANIEQYSAQLASLDVNFYDVKSFDEFENKRNQLVNSLSEMTEFANKTPEELKTIADTYISQMNGSLEKYSSQIQQIEEMTSQYGKENQEEIKKWVTGLSEEELTILYTLDIKETSYEDLQNKIDEAIELTKGKKIELQLTAVTDLRDSISSGEKIDEEKRTELEKTLGDSINWEEFDLSTSIEQLEILSDLTDKLNQQTLEYYENMSLLEEDNKVKEEDRIKRIEELSIKLEEAKTKHKQASNLGDYYAAEAEIKTLLEELEELEDISYTIDFDLNFEETALDIMENKVESIISKADALKSAAELIGEGFLVASEDAQALNDVYPALMENAQVLADGSIQLNQDVVKAIMEGNSTVLTEDSLTTQEQLENKITLLDAEIAYQQSKIKALQQYLQGEITAQEMSDKVNKAGALYEEQLIEALGVVETNAAQLEIDNSVKTTDIALTNLDKIGERIKAVSLAYSQMLAGEIAEYTPGGTGAVGGTAASYSGGGEVENVDSSLSDNDKNAVQNQLDAAQSELDILLDTRSEYTNLLSKLRSGTKDASDALGGAASGTGGKQGEGKKEERNEEYKNKEDEIDRYWELNKAIEAVTEELSDLDKKQDKLYGKELIASLKEENELLAEQAERYRALAAEQEKEANELQGLLSAYGVVFDAQGGVTNYLAASQAALDRYNQAVAAYNAFLIDEATFQAEQRAYENFKSLLERYEALYYEEMKETQNKLDEIHRQELENNLKAWEVEIQLKLDMSEIERQWEDFFKDINENFKLVYEDLDATMENLMNKTKTYQGDDGDIATTLQAIKDVQAEIDKMQNGEESDMFESVSQAQEKLKELNEQLQDSALAMKELWQEAWEAYLEGIDQAEEQFDDLMDRYENINEQIEYQKELIELLYGEEAYDLMNKYYETQQKNTMSEINSLKQQADLWKEQYEKALAIDEANGTMSEDTQKYYELWQEAQEELNGKVIDYIDLLQNDYKNAIAGVISDLEKSLTGGTTLDEVKEQWELLQEQADKYYDDVERIYEISNLAGKYETSIANTSELKNQQKLQELYDREMEYLENKKYLTEYDLEVANARYDMALKQIALEEAQQNKNAMKLVKGADGNWSYQYVADEDDIASKQQALLEAANQYYQITKEGYYENLEDMMNAQATYLEKLQEINEIYINDEEMRAQKAQELYEMYYGEGGILTLLYTENEERRTNMADATLQSLITYYEIDEENYERMTTKEQELIDGLKDETLSNYDDMLEKAQEVCQETLDAWTSSAQEIANQWYKDGGDSVKAQIIQAYRDMETANKSYQDAVAALEKAVEQNFGEKGITGALNDAQKETEELDDKTEELCNNAETNLEKYRDAVDKIEEAWNAVKEQIQDAIDLLEYYLNLMGATSSGDSGESSGGGSTGSDGGTGSGDTGGNTGDGDSGKSGGTKTKKYNPYGYTTWGSTGDGRSLIAIDLDGDGKKDVILEESQAKNKYSGKLWKNPNVFDTGGYTGDWNGGSGKLAVLHSKELVLNANDTENMLAAVNTVRQIANLGDSINQSIMNGISQMILGLTGLGHYGNYSIGDSKESGDTIFEIQANFPNANDVESIREAIMSLPNLASQYIARNKK